MQELRALTQPDPKAAVAQIIKEIAPLLKKSSAATVANNRYLQPPSY